MDAVRNLVRRKLDERGISRMRAAPASEGEVRLKTFRSEMSLGQCGCRITPLAVMEI
jgi:hypothetical protein